MKGINSEEETIFVKGVLYLGVSIDVHISASSTMTVQFELTIRQRYTTLHNIKEGYPLYSTYYRGRIQWTRINHINPVWDALGRHVAVHNLTSQELIMVKQLRINKDSSFLLIAYFT
ncbi:hypothetical protein CEXT_692331 [Caerostris extrusa]|uniref:Uncharacterized protein n=1 Tax=Caerostris extrusa TaxID=172846 RepID=A0AAV4Y9Z3_CAEEX|nr:hypothetical protein CEXT_692331 [Caerostris extrusa]